MPHTRNPKRGGHPVRSVLQRSRRTCISIAYFCNELLTHHSRLLTNCSCLSGTRFVRIMKWKSTRVDLRTFLSSNLAIGSVLWPNRRDCVNIDLLQFRRYPFFSGLKAGLDYGVHWRSPPVRIHLLDTKCTTPLEMEREFSYPNHGLRLTAIFWVLRQAPCLRRNRLASRPAPRHTRSGCALHPGTCDSPRTKHRRASSRMAHRP